MAASRVLQLLVPVLPVLPVLGGDCPDHWAALQLARRSREIVINGLGAGGNPTPKTNASNVNFDNETLECSDEKWKPGEGYVWTFSQIAEAFMTYGADEFYEPGTGPDELTQCVAALVIAAGECSPILGQGCNASATGPSGVFQLDFLRTTTVGDAVNPYIDKDGYMNLCISGFGAGFMTATPWYDYSASQVATLESASFTTCMEAPAYVNNYSCPDPNSVAGTTYTNYIGPFCHKGYATHWSPCNVSLTTDQCCGIWMGGANSYQDPFPDYYLEKAQEQMDNGVNFTSICEALLDDSEEPDADTGRKRRRRRRRRGYGAR